MLAKFKETKIYLGWKKLINDLKPMTARQRVEHLWMYYKEYLLCVFIVLSAISLVATIIINRSKETLVSGMLVNISMEQAGFDYLSTDYLERLGGVAGKQLAELDYTSFGDPLDPEHGEDYYYASLILTSRVSGKMLDYMILDKYAMEYYIQQDVYMDLRKIFTEAELAQLESKQQLIYAMEEGSDDRKPVAIKITDIAFVKNNVHTDGDIYFALSGSSPRPDMCRDAWTYINAWQKKDS